MLALTSANAAVLALAVAIVLALAAPGAARAATEPSSVRVAAPAGATTPDDMTSPVDTTNPFLPENANLGDCLSSLPRPDCGSTARGGFAQWATLVALVAGLTFIGWRVVRGARRNAAAAATRDAAQTQQRPPSAAPPTP